MSASFVCPNPAQQGYKFIADNRDAALHLPIFPDISFELHAGEEQRVALPELDNLKSKTIAADTCGMKCMPATVTEYLVDQFTVLPNVRSVLVGESDGVHHVWILLDEWTPEHRKDVYAIQMEILKNMRKIKDFNFDFYVLDIPTGVRPQDVVSDIPVAYYRD